jgi:hypothetical protein
MKPLKRKQKIGITICGCFMLANAAILWNLFMKHGRNDYAFVAEIIAAVLIVMMICAWLVETDTGGDSEAGK